MEKNTNAKEKTKQELMKEIRDEVFFGAHLPLYAERTQNKAFPVIGEGSHDARIVFIGEAPGRNEAKTGRPFCGAAGKILDSLLSSVEIPREDVYITNIVKDRPPQNRDPRPEEIEAYAPFLLRQLDIIKPRVVATLGRYSMKYIFETYNLWEELAPISKLHGRVFSAGAAYGTVTLLPLYHPAAAIYDRSLLPILEADFSILKKHTL